MLTIQDLHSRSDEIKHRLDKIFLEMEQDGYVVLTFERAAEIVNLLIEAKSLSNRIGYHSILTTTHCSGPH
jgi:translation initiation factor 2B subunit (eIF-2B alpha/beta/delta family)